MSLLSRVKTFFLDAYIHEFRDSDRWRAFFHSRLWIGLPVAPAVLFLAGYLQRYFGEGMPLGTALTKGAIEAALGAFCYILGIWASTVAEEPETDADKSGARYDWSGLLIYFGLLLLAFSLMCVSQIHDLWVGEGSVGQNLREIFVKLLCLSTIFVLTWNVSKRK